MPNTAILKLQVIADATKAVSAMKDMSGAADKASTKTQTAGSRLKSMGGVAAKVAGAAALGGLVAVFKTGMTEQSDFLAGQAQLANGLKTTGNAANTSVKDMENLAGSIQGYSGQTDDSIVASEKLLLTFTNIQNKGKGTSAVFDEATKMTADMAAKMGGDASTYAVQLGKALNDPIKGITSLTRVGVSFTDAQKKSIKTMQESGNTMGAQKIVLAELKKEFGGSAKAAGDTLPGQMAKAKRSFEDISQQLIASLMPAITKLADLLTNDLMPIFAKVMDFVGKNIKWLLPLAAGIYLAVKAYKAWVVVNKLLTEANKKLILSFATNPITIWIVAIIALVAAFVYAYKHFTWFRNAVQAVIRSITSAFGWLVTGIRKVWATIWPILKKWGPVALAVLNPFIGLPLLIALHWRKIIGWIRSVWNRVTGIVKAGAKGVSTAVKWMVDKVKTIISTVFKIYITPWRLAWQALRTLVSKWAPAVLGWMKNIVSKIVAGLSTVAAKIKAPFESAWTWIKNNIVQPMKNMFHGLAGAITTALSGVKDAITAPFKAAWDWIKRYVLSPLSSGWNAIAHTINAVEIHIPKVHIPLDGDIGGGTIGFPDIPTLPSWATGAYVTAPTAALIGEAGGEWVLPDSKLRAMLRQELGAAGVTVIVNGALDPDAVARQIDKVLRGRARRVGGPKLVGTATV